MRLSLARVESAVHDIEWRAVLGATNAPDAVAIGHIVNDQSIARLRWNVEALVLLCQPACDRAPNTAD